MNQLNVFTQTYRKRINYLDIKIREKPIELQTKCKNLFPLLLCIKIFSEGINHIYSGTTYSKYFDADIMLNYFINI